MNKTEAYITGQEAFQGLCRLTASHAAALTHVYRTHVTEDAARLLWDAIDDVAEFLAESIFETYAILSPVQQRLFVSDTADFLARVALNDIGLIGDEIVPSAA